MLRAAERPLSVAELTERIGMLRPITTAKPQTTIRGVLSYSPQLVSVGAGRYGYLPRLIVGSLLRLPLTSGDLASGRITYPWEAVIALWPGFHDAAARGSREPVLVRLPDGLATRFLQDHLSGPGWHTPLSPELSGYLEREGAAAGDSLLIRIDGSEPITCVAWLEHASERDEAAVAARNAALADGCYAYLKRTRSSVVLDGELITAALARGLYQADTAPDCLVSVLAADCRFEHCGHGAWALRRSLTLQQALDVGLALDDYLLEPDTPPRDLAQGIVYDAWELAHAYDRLAWARLALSISPDCADAYGILAEDGAASLEEEISLYEAGVAAGERVLASLDPAEYAGMYWGVLATRPYMRARLGLALALWKAGRRDEALGHLRGLLELNPNDNQGVRFVLLGYLLIAGMDAAAEALLSRYDDGFTAAWTYGLALVAYRKEGDSRTSRRFRARARDANRHVPDYLSGLQPLPIVPPEYIGVGDEREAQAYAEEQIEAWRATPGAIEWLLLGGRSSGRSAREATPAEE